MLSLISSTLGPRVGLTDTLCNFLSKLSCNAVARQVAEEFNVQSSRALASVGQGGHLPSLNFGPEVHLRVIFSVQCSAY